jgi:hypothetical protein
MTSSTKADLLAGALCLIAGLFLYFTISSGFVDSLLFDGPEQVELYKEAVKQ